MSNNLLLGCSTVSSPPRSTIEYGQVGRDTDVIGRGGQAVVYEVDLRDGYPIERIAPEEPLVPNTLKDTIDEFIKKAATWRTMNDREQKTTVGGLRTYRRRY